MIIFNGDDGNGEKVIENSDDVRKYDGIDESRGMSCTYYNQHQHAHRRPSVAVERKRKHRILTEER